MIGGSASIAGVSPEVRKKVTIGVELISDPLILFLDEPTTGLDSSSAVAVMDAVRENCKNRVVICTIHQPSREIFERFDWMLLLQAGGHMAYFGPLSNLVPFFVGLGHDSQEDKNPADFALDCCTGIQEDSANDLWLKSSWKGEEENMGKIEEDNALLDHKERLEHNTIVNFPPISRNFCVQFKEIFKTQFRYLVSNIKKLLFNLFLAHHFFLTDSDNLLSRFPCFFQFLVS